MTFSEANEAAIIPILKKKKEIWRLFPIIPSLCRPQQIIISVGLSCLFNKMEVKVTYGPCFIPDLGSMVVYLAQMCVFAK